MKRRAVLGAGAGTVAVAGTGLGVQQALAEDGVTAAASAKEAADEIKKSYEAASTEAGGWWKAYISVADGDGKLTTAVDQKSEDSVEAWSCNKVPVATAVLEKVDRGDLKIDQLIEVPEDIVSDDGDGIFWLDGAYPSKVTLGHVLANMLTVSDNTAVRLCGTVVPAEEINEILKDKGFSHTQVEPSPDNPNRFFLGLTTPQESHEIWQQLVKGDLLSKESTERILKSTRAMVAFTDGIRRNMSSDERSQIATKAGWFDDSRGEVGIIFDANGAPVLTYSMFAGGQDGADDFGATHPAVEARAKMGRDFLDIVSSLQGDAKTKHSVPQYEPGGNGG